jgi:hypothetical protein
MAQTCRRAIQHAEMGGRAQGALNMQAVDPDAVDPDAVDPDAVDPTHIQIKSDKRLSDIDYLQRLLCCSRSEVASVANLRQSGPLPSMTHVHGYVRRKE